MTLQDLAEQIAAIQRQYDAEVAQMQEAAESFNRCLEKARKIQAVAIEMNQKFAQLARTMTDRDDSADWWKRGGETDA